MTEQSLTTTHKQTIREYMRQDEIVTRFAEILGDYQASAYISSVLIAVAQSDNLQACTFQSIVSSALRAATLKLSCDPATGQAHLVPFKGKATLVVGYKGLYHMALRTGKYRYINIIEVHPGETVTENRLTGMHTITGTYTDHDNIIGIMVYLEMVNGFKKTVYMTVEEIAEHAQKFSKSYSFGDSVWKTNRRAMEKKTVLRLALSRWGYIDPNDQMYLNTSDDEVDGVVSELPDVNIVPDEVINPDVAMEELGFTPQNNGHKDFPGITLDEALNFLNSEKKKYGDIDSAKLRNMYNALAKVKDPTDDQLYKIEVIKVILKDRNNSVMSTAQKLGGVNA